MRDFLTIGAVGVTVAAALVVGTLAVVRAIKALPAMRNGVSLPSGSYRLFRPRKEAVPLLAVGGFFAALWMSSEWWSAMQRAEARRRAEQIDMAARAEVQAAYEAAAQPQAEPSTAQVTTKPTISSRQQGYVYLGQCDKQWVSGTARFTRMPSCIVPLPSDGFQLISRQGDIIRATLPVTENGHRRFGEEVSRVSAGYSIILRKMFPVSLFTSGPQYYWGLVDFPTDKPPVR